MAVTGKESAVADGRSGPPITGDARGGTLADMTTTTYSTGQQRAQGGHTFPSSSIRTTGPSRQDTHATHVTTARGSPHDDTHEMNYQNPIKNMTLNDGVTRVRRRMAPIGATIAGAAWTASGCSLRKALARQSPQTLINDAT